MGKRQSSVLEGQGKDRRECYAVNQNVFTLFNNFSGAISRDILITINLKRFVDCVASYGRLYGYESLLKPS